MIATKFGLKYPMPHSVVHIVDNSAYSGELPTVMAEDPSMFSTLVVTGTPMGEDNKVITVTRQDVLNTAFGIGSLTSEDVSRYGQTVEYPSSLIEQGAPVRLMRVTPEGSTYGIACVVVQWYWNDLDDKMHVRFKIKDVSGLNIQFDRFKNTEKLNAALIRNVNLESTVTENGHKWNQRVFINYISAGRGKVYNNMVVSINPTQQTKKPPNVKYEFVTIDTRTNNICEKFEASLVNTNNSNLVVPIESANVVVGKRLAGSSIVVPYINENAVKEIYNDYIDHYKEMLDRSLEDEFVNTVYRTLNVNTFDIIYGEYIYNGSEYGRKLPYYQVDMVDTEIPSLPATNRINVLEKTTFDPSNPKELYDQFDAFTYGVSRDKDNVYVGDLYLNSENSSFRPVISIVGAINQYTGAVTSLTIPKLFPLKGDTIDKTSSKGITTIFNDTINGSNSTTLNALVSKGIIKVDDIVANVSGNEFTLYTVLTVNPNAVSGDKYTLSKAYTKEQVYQALDWSSHPSGDLGTGNIIGRNNNHAAFRRFGSAVVDENSGKVYVNGYSDAYGFDSNISEGRVQITNNSCKFGVVPSDVNITIDIVGAQYDILVYDKNDTSFEGVPNKIHRYIVSGVQGSLFRIQEDTSVEIPNNYYSDEFGISFASENGGVRLEHGSTGFFDNDTMNSIEFKWRYSVLLVKAYRGEIDPRIMSPTRVPAKYLFDGGTNTIIGQTILPNLTYTPIDIINSSTIFTEDEKEDLLLSPEIISNIKYFEDCDVKQAMYDLMIYRCYQGIPEDKRPVGPGSGLSLHLDSGVTDANTTLLVNKSFSKRFNNPNASWDIGGWVDVSTGRSYTFVKQIVDNLHRHSKQFSVNKPYTGKYTMISPQRYNSYFPDVDTTDWDFRELLYNSGGNAWIADVNGNLTRRSQRTLNRTSDSSDLIQESNMRTLSQLVYLVQNKIDDYLTEYDDDGVLKTLSDEVNNMFTAWVGNMVDSLDIQFTKDINTDGGDIVVCDINVTFRGLILRVPIIVNVNRRVS